MSRSHETSITIDAPLEEVWRAITEAREIERWFAPEVRVVPGVGGTMFGSWGPGMEGTQTIEVWEPNRQLRLIDERVRPHAGAGDGPTRLVIDYFFETENGKTVLRLVHSGWGAGPNWDGEFEGTRSGWSAFFRTLRHGLERHPGQPVKNMSFFHTAPAGDGDALWAQFFDTLDRLNVAWKGQELQRSDAPKSYSGIVAGTNDAMLTAALSSRPNANFIYVNLVLYGLSPERLAEVEQAWKSALATLPTAAMGVPA